MKLNKTTQLTLAATLDSSEAVMFNKGGMHTFSIKPDDLKGADQFSSITLSFQIERKEHERYNFITGQNKDTSPPPDRGGNTFVSKPFHKTEKLEDLDLETGCYKRKDSPFEDKPTGACC